MMAIALAAFSLGTRLVACLPGQQVAKGEQHHQRQQQQLARHLAAEGGEHRGANRHAQSVEADQQAGGRQADPEVGTYGG